MRAVFIVAALFAINCALPISEEEEKQWNNFKLKYNRTYATVEEEHLRQKIFVENLKEIKEHNEKYDAGVVTFTKRVTQFSDMTNEEFVSTLTLKVTKSPIDDVDYHVPKRNIKLPDHVDWRDQGAVTPVRHQGNCGSCYAFTAAGAIEAQLFKKSGKLRAVSEQNLLDCTRALGNLGCDGGDLVTAFEYVVNNGGIATAESYPYEGVERKCRYKRQNSAGTISGVKRIQQGSERDLQDAVANGGPVAVAVNAINFQHYDKGVNNDPNCDPETLTHGVLVVGYGTENGQDYWIAKNSWGRQFGEDGYIRMARNKGNHVEEEKLRQKIFVQNLKEVKKHNEKYETGFVTYTKGINQFSDMTKMEFISSTLTLNYTNLSRHKINLHVPLRNVKLPNYVNWKEKGAVTPVKNQGYCKSCFAFSATGALEGQLFKHTGRLFDLSEQNLIDCSRPQGNSGCDGGFPLRAFKYVQQNGGINTEDSYPYEEDEGKCRYNAQNSAGTIRRVNYIQRGSESDLQDAVANVGPISAGINGESFYQYDGGIYDVPDCDSFALNHAVVVVGYGTENGQDYWIVKNSWGENFGENGYIRMARNKGNQCGIASDALYPLV
ncbi:hypothetical protein ILUMI_20926 [Ignelater luminosus]|uniref:Cathepsin L n=1 Tax=Ignelater luminosus TaxID=2038154 RepID=A0A8K0CD80_IGNLU|nr:hypothetical protein ILUMI_20926 [Ignelater luminosus]